MSKTINMASSAKNSNAEATVKEIMVSNVENYINEYVLDCDEEVYVDEIDEDYGLLTISDGIWTVRMSFDGTLFEFKTNDGDFIGSFGELEKLMRLKENQYDIIEVIDKITGEIESKVIAFMVKAREEASRELDGYNGEVIFKDVEELNDYLGFNLLEQDEKTQDYVNTIIKNNYEICEMFIINEAA